MTDKEPLPTWELDINQLRKAVETAAAFRCRRRLQPAGGEGDKVFPPTFSGALYAEEKRHVTGCAEPVKCVLLDSVQSQANRMELALQRAVDGGRVKMPLVIVDFSAHDPTGDALGDNDRLTQSIGKISSLQVPHRIADAIIRDSEVDGQPFRKSPKGRLLDQLSVSNATAVFELCPTALIFGMWDSTGPKGGLGAKFERAVVSEIVGVGAEVGDLRRGVRHDPLAIRAAIKVLRNTDKSWAVASDKKAEKGQSLVAPSEINHSNVPFPKQRDEKTKENTYDGITFKYAEQTTTLSLIVLRQLCFPLHGLSAGVDSNLAARTVLAALGLCAATLAFESGMALRSRCLLWPEGPMIWELLDFPGEEPRKYSLTGESAIRLLDDAVELAKKSHLPWSEVPLILKPSEQLVKLVKQSQLEATKEGPDQN